MKFIQNIVQIADNYDNLIIDLWGVLHDGSNAYPNAQKCLEELSDLGKNIILLSNAPRRATKAVGTLNNLNFNKGLYQDIVTSGEVAWLYFKDKFLGGKRFYYIGPQKDYDILDGLDYTHTENANEADFCLVTGFDYFGQGFESKQAQIDAAFDAGLQMVCVNPDRIVVRITGEKMLCAGLIAEHYAERGGEVKLFGKPYKDCYDEVFTRFSNKDKQRTLAIGDSLHTDIKGANDYGIDSLLISSGILMKDLGTQFGQLPNKEKLEELSKKENATPTYVISEFKF